ncbi:MAG: helix-turn-helix domain-containing protein [Clostridia bacterium]|nr:helix-turn-helix domain-containing protein [Clostridia bacterium]
MGIGSVLTKLLKERGTNVHEIASKAGIKPSTLYSIIQRDSMSANVRDMWRIAHMLDITLDYFYELIQVENGDNAPGLFDDEFAQSLRQKATNVPQPEEFAETCISVQQNDLDFLRDECDYLEVADDSMMPEYELGDIIMVMPGKLPNLGEDGIFVRDGRALLRRRVAGALLALDPQIEPIPYPTKHPFESVGTVVGRVRLRD